MFRSQAKICADRYRKAMCNTIHESQKIFKSPERDNGPYEASESVVIDYFTALFMLYTALEEAIGFLHISPYLLFCSHFLPLTL